MKKNQCSVEPLHDAVYGSYIVLCIRCTSLVTNVLKDVQCHDAVQQCRVLISLLPVKGSHVQIGIAYTFSIPDFLLDLQ